MSLDDTDAYTISQCPLLSMLTNSDVHLSMSNVWDRYRVKDVHIDYTISPTANSSRERNPTSIVLFTVYDSHVTGQNITLKQLQTYDTYTSTTVSTVPDNPSPHHITRYEEYHRRTNTKITPLTPTFLFGVYTGTFAKMHFQASLQFRFTVEYSGSRFDNSYALVYTPTDRLPLVHAAAPRPVTPEPPAPPSRWEINGINMVDYSIPRNIYDITLSSTIYQPAPEKGVGWYKFTDPGIMPGRDNVTVLTIFENVSEYWLPGTDETSYVLDSRVWFPEWDPVLFVQLPGILEESRIVGAAILPIQSGTIYLYSNGKNVFGYEAYFSDVTLDYDVFYLNLPIES